MKNNNLASGLTKPLVEPTVSATESMPVRVRPPIFKKVCDYQRVEDMRAADIYPYFKALESEVRVFDNNLWVAGTLDLIGSIGGKRVLMDIKTGQKHKWHHLQTAGYALLSDNENIKRYCLYLTKKETYKLEPHESNSDYSLFKSMAEVYNKKGKYQ